MFTNLKEYMDYNRNRKIMKRELAGICAATFPAIRMFSEKQADFLQFMIRLADSTKDVSGSELIDRVMKEITDKLSAGEPS